MRFGAAQFQIGKNGITEGTIDALANLIQNYQQIRISVLKSSGRDRNSIREMADELCQKLKAKTQKGFLYKIVGFTIILKRGNPRTKQ
jgi:RNA-binding protein YhbY